MRAVCGGIRHPVLFAGNLRGLLSGYVQWQQRTDGVRELPRVSGRVQHCRRANDVCRRQLPARKLQRHWRRCTVHLVLGRPLQCRRRTNVVHSLSSRYMRARILF